MLPFFVLPIMTLCLGLSTVFASETHFLLNTSGGVQLKRNGWSNYTRVDFGARLRSDDLLRVKDTATVLCANLMPKSMSSGIASTPCSPGPGVLSFEGAQYVVRSENPHKKVPRNLYPRNTLVLDNRPSLRWHDTGASSYTVAIMDGGTAVWTQEKVVGIELVYPSDAPALRPNIDYLLHITDNDTDLTSMEDLYRGTGFQVIGQSDATIMAATREKIMGLNSLNNYERQFALAAFYSSPAHTESGFSPLAEAWQILIHLIPHVDTPAVHLLLGDVLAAMKLPNEGQAAYQVAIARAEALDDSYSRAVAHAQLWRMTREEQYREKAIKLYERVGDQEQIEFLKSEGKE